MTFKKSYTYGSAIKYAIVTVCAVSDATNDANDGEGEIEGEVQNEEIDSQGRFGYSSKPILRCSPHSYPFTNNHDVADWAKLSYCSQIFPNV